jgi:AcrR family transcriptional regulator
MARASFSACLWVPTPGEYHRSSTGYHARRMTAKTTPRRRPTQDRAHATVDAIVHAAGLLLRQRGWTASTTNHIAERAGVSIGSLYKYFPNKEAIVAEVARRRIADEVDSIVGELASTGDPRATLERVVDAMIERYRANAELDTVLLEQLGEIEMTVQLRAGEAEVVRATAAYFARHRIADAEAAFVLVHALRGVLVAAATRSLDPQALRAHLLALTARFCFP